MVSRVLSVYPVRASLVLAFVVVVGSCTKLNPLYCERNTDCQSFSCDVPSRACNPIQECTNSAMCSAPGAPICDDGRCVACDTPGASTECEAHDPALGFCADGRCVQCLADSACDGTAPICKIAENECRGCSSSAECILLTGGRDFCAPSGECVACLTHSDCATTSQVCVRNTNVCAAVSDVYFVDGVVGTDVGGCGPPESTPCKTIEFGLAMAMGAGKPFLRVRIGNYAGNIVHSAGSITIVAPGVSLLPLGGGDPVIEVDNSATLTIDGMTLRGVVGGGDPVGVRCRDTGTRLTLYDIRITLNEGAGIDSVGCTLSIQGGSIDSNGGVGIIAFSGEIELHNVQVYGNNDGGIHLLSVQYDLTNNFIVQNGRAGAGGSDIGGMRVDNATEMRPQRLAFNTIAGNNARDGVSSSGVQCDTSGTATPIISSNIVYGNVGGAQQVNGDCVWRYSNLAGSNMAGSDENIDEDPMFVAVIDRDYHLRAGSPCVNAGERINDIRFDFDGETRGGGGGYDIGADEL